MTPLDRPTRRCRRRPARSARLLHAVLLLAAAAALAAPVAGAAVSEAGVADARQAVADADRALARAVAAHDPAAFRRLLADDAVFLGAAVERGPAAVARAWAPYFTAGGPRLEWEPEEVVVAASGDLAYSSGPFRFTPAGADVAAAPTTGTYLTVWRHHAAAGWRVVADGSRADDAEALVAEAADALDLDGTGLDAADLDPRIERGEPRRVASAAGDLSYAVGPVTVRLTGPDGPAEATATLLSVWRGDDPVDPAAQAVSAFRRSGG